MKKILFLLLLPFLALAQIPTTGQEQSFDYGIQNNVSPTDDNAPYFTAQNADGVMGKSNTSTWAKKVYVDNSISWIESNDDLSDAKRKDDVLYGILDQYTGEEITLSKVTGTPTVDSIIYFQLGAEYFKRDFESINVKWFGALGNDTGDDSDNIQLALNYGGSIYLPKGTYKCANEFEMVSNSSFFGDGYDSQLHIIPSGGGQTWGLRVKNKNNCSISKMRVYGDGITAADLTSAIDIYGSNNCTVSSVFVDTAFLGIGCGNVSLTQSTGISIINNYVSNIGLNAIYCNTFGDNNRIDNNHISEFGILASAINVASAIEYRGSGSGSCSGNIITNGNYGTGAYNDGLRIEFATEGLTKYPDFLNVNNNVIKNTYGHGIRLQFVKNCNVSNNIISEIEYGYGILLLSDLEISEGNNISNNNISYVNDEAGIFLQGSVTDEVRDNSISHNSIYSCKDGIIMYYSNDNLIQNNNIFKNVQNGISIYASSLSNIISNNKITDNTLIGVLLSSSDKTTINNNTITGNVSQGINITSGATNTHLIGGLIYGNSSDVIDSSGSTTYNLSESNGNFKTNSIDILNGSASNFLKSNGSSNSTLTESGGSIIVGTDPSGLGKLRVGGDAWIGGHILMPDSTYDIGNASHTGRPRNIYTNGLYLDNTSISAGGYAFLTQNTSTLETEKIASTSIAPIASPTFTGAPTAPTAAPGTNTTQIATTAFVQGNSSSGIYTPTLTNTTNITSSTLNKAVYTKIGDIVTVTVGYSATPTASGNCVITLPLPIARSVSTTIYAGSGQAVLSGSIPPTIPVFGLINGSSTDIAFNFAVTGTTDIVGVVTFIYSVN